MERFDPHFLQATPVSPSHWEYGAVAGPRAGFEARAIGELIRSIVARFDENGSRPDAEL
jgi:hypothetical protein